MNEDREHDLQAWFDRSIQELPHQPFARAVAEKVKRKERVRRLQRQAAVLVACLGAGVLLPELFVPINTLATLPSTAIAAVGEQWPVFLPLAGALIYRLLRRALNRVSRIS